MLFRLFRSRGNRITATPNPIPVDYYSDLGQTTVTWNIRGRRRVEIRSGAPDGPVFASSETSGAATTGSCVADGMSFYLQDASRGNPADSANTLDVVTVGLKRPVFSPPLNPNVIGESVTSYVAHGGGRKVVVGGHFSFEHGATAGDLMALSVACGWLREAGCSYEVVLAPPFQSGGIRLDQAAAKKYSDFLFVCGPFANRDGAKKLADTFSRMRKIGLNISMIAPVEEWNPFDRLLERDSSRASRPDISFASPRRTVPVVGVVFPDPGSTPEYRQRAFHKTAYEAVHALAASREMSLVQIDTCLPGNATGLRTPAEVESLIARMDAVVTMRLHGLVLALRNSVPAVAIDPYLGGDKISRQAEVVGWPLIFTPDRWRPRILDEALNYALTPEARALAAQCARNAVSDIDRIREDFIAEFRGTAA